MGVDDSEMVPNGEPTSSHLPMDRHRPRDDDDHSEDLQPTAYQRVGSIVLSPITLPSKQVVELTPNEDPDEQRMALIDPIIHDP